MKIQVHKSHYQFRRYFDKKRWSSLWYQISEVLALAPESVLEIGPGPGIFRAIASQLGVKVKTLDIDPALNPDYISSVFDMPFQDESFDVVCAFQMLEHLPFNQSLIALKEILRIAGRYVVISLPDASPRYNIAIQIPKLGSLSFCYLIPRLWGRKHVFDGEHYWEINKEGYSLKKIIKAFEELCTSGEMEFRLVKTFRVNENSYHRFFVFEKC